MFGVHGVDFNIEALSPNHLRRYLDLVLNEVTHNNLSIKPSFEKGNENAFSKPLKLVICLPFGPAE